MEDEDLLESMGVRVAKSTPEMIKAWMHFHNFVLVESIDQVRKVIDHAYEVGSCSLDLETQGLDSRIYYKRPEEIKGLYEEYWEGDRPKLLLQTVHKVVGYCISVDGHTGYYIPVRHVAENSNNLDPVAVGKLIKELCVAAQPTLTEEGFAKDPLSSPLIAEPGKVKIAFWNAKFDQEFLYPITGIDWWHPDSYEDSMLLYFARNTSDKNLSLKAKSKTDLYVKDKEGKPILGIVRPNPHNPIQELVEVSPTKGDRIPYEMIELKDLFGKGREIKFAELHPTEGLRYGCSDGICTILHIREPAIASMIKDKKFAFMYRLDKQTQQITRIMERPRILIDIENVKKTFTEAREEANEYRHQLVTLAEQHGFHSFDPQSSAQVSDFFFAKSSGLNIEPKPEKNEKSGQYKTDADTLEKLVAENDDVNPILLTLVKYRQIEKVIGTYLENMIANVDSNGELRYQFKQVGAATTRFSAPAGQGDQGFGGVPIHGIPATYDDKKPKVATKLRQLFKARPGYAMVKIDYSGEELRIVTNLSREPVWINEFLNGTGDLHTITAQAFFGKTEVTKQERQMGKCVHPDTLVIHQNRGFIPLRSLAEFPQEADTFQSVSAGKLLAGGKYEPVVATYNGGVKPLFHIVSRKGVLTCSAEHRIQLEDGSLKRTEDLVKGDVLSPIQTGSVQEPEGVQEASFQLWEGVPPAKYTLTPEMGYFAGVYLGDGTTNKKSANIAHGEVQKLDFSGRPYKQWQDNLMGMLKGLGFNPEPKKDTIYLGSVVVNRFLQCLELNKGAQRTFRVPSWVLSGGKEMILQFLGGLIDTDGNVSRKYGSIEFTTKDFVFAGQIAMLCKAVGLDFACDPTFNKTYQRYYLRLRFTVGSSWLLKDYIRHEGKVARIRPGLGEMTSRAIPENAVMIVIPAGRGPCLDVTMGTEEHLYSTNGFITHNSANFSLVYGGGVQAVQRATKCNPQEAARRKANFDKSVPKFALWQKGQKAKAHKDKGVYSAFGRWMALTEIDSPEKFIVASCERQSTNYPIQGCQPASNRILTNYGYLTIGEVRKNKPADMLVWTGSKWAPFTIRAMGAWERATIELTDGTTTQCDTRHTVLKVTEEGYSWVNWKDLQPGDRIATPMAYPVNFKKGAKPLPAFPASISPPTDWEEEFWYWIGRYYGDGVIGKTVESSKPRNTLTTVFGPTETEDIKRCVSYWEKWGFNPRVQTCIKKGEDRDFIRYTVTVENRDFHQWLNSAGFVGAIASTKRLADRVYCESLVNRKSLIRGMMDSDGHKPPMFSVSGEPVGNPYNIHLCQKPLLLDFKLLLRTLGVESVVRGPYVSGRKKKNRHGEDTISYRVDINRRMYERNIEGVKNRLPKLHDLFAPRFMVDDFLSKVPELPSGFRNPAIDGTTASHRVMKSRLKRGGQVTVYTLQDMCEAYGVELDNPLYSFSTVKSKEALGFEEETFSLSVKDDLHRYEAEGVIHKNTGADIMRMALVMTHKEFYKRGWYQSGGVRTLLTVHDEIVFEVKFELLQEAVPVIEHIMCEPGRIAKWEVPLEAEPLVDLTWDAKYDFNMVVKGKPHKEGDKVKPGHFVAGSRQYQQMPEWMEPWVIPDWKRAGIEPGEVKETPKPEKTEASKQEAPKPLATVHPIRPLGEVFSYPLVITTPNTVKQVWNACSQSLNPQGKVLHLVDGKTNQTLVSPDLGIRINPDEFVKILAEYNL